MASQPIREADWLNHDKTSCNSGERELCVLFTFPKHYLSSFFFSFSPLLFKNVKVAKHDRICLSVITTL